ncbi:MAG: hypothetical protein BRC54_04270 [Cyanobacteria bacterium SW_7_48_12]|nr:MAG: hypothetical protein BRC54_04270 [Cyanobacteria bacterium SW_7_48_12]
MFLKLPTRLAKHGKYFAARCYTNYQADWQLASDLAHKKVPTELNTPADLVPARWADSTVGWQTLYTQQFLPGEPWSQSPMARKPRFRAATAWLNQARHHCRECLVPGLRLLSGICSNTSTRASSLISSICF